MHGDYMLALPHLDVKRLCLCEKHCTTWIVQFMNGDKPLCPISFNLVSNNRHYLTVNLHQMTSWLEHPRVMDTFCLFSSSDITVNVPSDYTILHSLFPRRDPSPSDTIYDVFCLDIVNPLEVSLNIV